MNRTRSARRVLPVAILLAVGAAAVAQQEQPKPAASFNGTVLIVDHVALDQFFVDPKDRPLADALAMIPARLRELPMEIRDMPPEAAGVMNMVVTALARPGRLAVTYSETPSGGAFGYGVEFSVLTKDKDEADQLHAKLSAMIAQAGNLRTQPSKKFDGMTEVQTPVASLAFGPRKAADGWRYEVLFGTIQDPDAVNAALPEPVKGLTPVVRGHADFAGLLPAITMAEGFAGNQPQVAENLKMAREQIGGDHPIQVSFQSGYTSGESLSVVRFTNIPHPDKTPLASSDFGAVPSDATGVFLGRVADLEKIPAAIAAKAPPFADALDQFQQATGVDLEKDVLAAIGGTAAMYLSDATGGGSIGSAVFMITIKDRERLATAMTKLTASANQFAEQAPIGPGYIKVVPWKDAKTKGTDLISLRFPGLPVPLELTIGMTDKWLILAPTPQGAIAAARQASGAGDEGLTANKAFAAVFRGSVKPVSLSFTDTSRGLRTAYPFLSMAGSMIANGVRSPTDPSREPGMLVPIYPELAKGARASVSVTYWDGDARVTEIHGDRSVLVQAGGIIGEVAELLPAVAIPAAIGAGFAQAEQHGQRHGPIGEHRAAPAHRKSGKSVGILPEGVTSGNAAVLLVAGEALPELKLEAAVGSLVEQAAER